MRRKLIFFFYRILQAAAFPFLTVYVFWRVLRDRRYLRGFWERLGFLPTSYQRTAFGAIWLHAVSLGEVLSSVELIRRLRVAHPDASVFISCGTLAGRQVAEEKLSASTDGIFFAPLDYCFAVRRVLRHIRPASLIVLETEIWPNLYHETKRSGASLTVVNGRISPRALPKYLRFRWFFQCVLDLPDHLLVQSEEDAANYRLAGAPAGRVIAAGNLKYDFNPQISAVPTVVKDYLEHRPAKIWIAASTTAATNDAVDEDDAVIAAFQQVRLRHPELLLLLAPRKPERFDAVAGKLQAAGISFARRSTLKVGQRGDVLLLDSIGELGSLFGFANVVLMGGTITHRGGHNILEPAIFAKPVIIGPHMENFPEIAARFRSGNAIRAIATAEDLAPAVDDLLTNPEMARELGERAKQIAEAQRGATDRALQTIAADRARAIPHVLPYGPIHPLLWLLSKIWITGGLYKQRVQPKRLQTPVISIGGIGMGGAGKTPMVSFLAERLKSGGVEPAILTRGYGRPNQTSIVILGAGESAAAAVTGDEPQIFLRDGFAPVGIGADRHQTGLRMEGQFRPEVFLLDDGFQHRRLHRDFDLVLIDGIDPLAGGEVFPLGRLREPLESLRRASAFVITRTPGGGVREVLARYNPDAPVFQSRVIPLHWLDVETGTRLPPRSSMPDPVLAFCGLANPDAFWNTLQCLGIEPGVKEVFADHHRYTMAEIQKLAARGATLLTTEKDSVNLPPGFWASIAPTKLLWLKIGIEIEEEDKLMKKIGETIRLGVA